MKKINLALLILLLFPSKGHTQEGYRSDLISVKLTIITTQPTFIDSVKIKNYQSNYALATVINNQDTSISFWIMDASWQKDNLLTNNDSVHFLFPGCDMNGESKISLEPHKSINFYTIIASHKNFDSKFKIGFRFFKKIDELTNFLDRKDKIVETKIYWSKTMNFKNKLNSYELE